MFNQISLPSNGIFVCESHLPRMYFFFLEKKNLVAGPCEQYSIQYMCRASEEEQQSRLACRKVLFSFFFLFFKEKIRGHIYGLWTFGTKMEIVKFWDKSVSVS